MSPVPTCPGQGIHRLLPFVGRDFQKSLVDIDAVTVAISFGLAKRHHCAQALEHLAILQDLRG